LYRRGEEKWVRRKRGKIEIMEKPGRVIKRQLDQGEACKIPQRGHAEAGSKGAGMEKSCPEQNHISTNVIKQFKGKTIRKE
jgi:hypothetical protein